MIVIISKEMNEVALKLYCVVVVFLCKPVIRSWAFPWIWLTFDTASARARWALSIIYCCKQFFRSRAVTQKWKKKLSKTWQSILKLYLRSTVEIFCKTMRQSWYFVLRVPAYRHKTFIVFSQNKKQNFEREFLYDLVIRNACRSSN